jgi:hypothetical protein
MYRGGSRRRRGLALAGGVWLLTPAAAADPCAGLDPVVTRVEVAVDPGPAPSITAVPTDTIRQRAAAKAPGRIPSAHPAGLTAVTFQGRAGYSSGRSVRSDGTLCLSVEAVRVELTQREVTVLVDQKYPEGSCERAAILDHEAGHVRINAAALHQGETSFRRRLATQSADWRDRWVPETERPTVERSITRALQGTIADIEAAAAAEHAELDQPRSYERTQRRCSDW